jgi:hypothetical protein
MDAQCIRQSGAVETASPPTNTILGHSSSGIHECKDLGPNRDWLTSWPEALFLRYPRGTWKSRLLRLSVRFRQTDAALPRTDTVLRTQEHRLLSGALLHYQRMTDLPGSS